VCEQVQDTNVNTFQDGVQLQ